MIITVSEEIHAPRERVWKIITDIDSWTDTISGIVAIEVINRPASGIIDLKWRETRVLFGKEAVETMWITAARDNHWYETRAENHGAIYSTRISLEDGKKKTVLSMTFSSRPTTFVSRLMSFMGYLFRSSMRKMLQQDLADIRRAAEADGPR